MYFIALYVFPSCFHAQLAVSFCIEKGSLINQKESKFLETVVYLIPALTTVQEAAFFWKRSVHPHCFAIEHYQPPQ